MVNLLQAMKKIHISKHAQERMLQRYITEKEIEKAISDPDLVIPIFDKSRKRVSKKIGDKILDVVYKETENQYIIVAAIWLTKRYGEVKNEH